MPVAGADVIEAGIAEHVLHGVPLAHPGCLSFDDCTQLRFVVNAGRPRIVNLVLGADDRAGRFVEHYRFIRGRLADLFGVAVVIEADGHNLGRLRRCQELDLAELVELLELFDFRIRFAVDNLDTLPIQDTVLSFAADAVSYNFHSGISLSSPFVDVKWKLTGVALARTV